MRVLSMGGGVQTTAMLIMWKDKYDYVIFADPGDEMPETYWYISEYLKPYAGEKWITVKRPGPSLYDYHFDKKKVPFIQHRECTRKWKIEPINKMLKELGATKNNPITVDIGISGDESGRIGGDKHTKNYEIKKYPLAEQHITRDQCKQIIKDHGWPVPEKSGCYYCGLQPRNMLRKLRYTHPELYRKAMALEKNAGKPLNVIKNLPGITGTLDGYCDSGHCFV